MANLKSNLEQYLSNFSLEALDEYFWFPNSKIGFHLMELDDKVLTAKSEQFKSYTKKIVKRLKSTEVRLSNLPIQQPQSLHGLIKTWETLSQLEEGPETELVKSALSFQPLHRNHFYACLFNDVFDGLRAKREFRLHYTKTFVPLIANKGGNCLEIHAQLESATCSGLLFAVSGQQVELLKDCDHLGMAVFPNELFRTRDPETADQISGLKLKKPFWGGQQKKMPTVKVDMEMAKISRCHIEMTPVHEKMPRYFLYIPFDGMKDAVNEKESLNQRVFKKNIHSIAKSVAELAVA